MLASRYRILELLGEGGMGAVYRARDLTLGEDVAVKLLAPELAGDPERVDYFRNEVLLARRVTHPNVCRLHDIACEDGHWFITMEYIAGESLADRLQVETAATSRDETDDITQIDVERIFTDVARGLAAAHAVGVVHRDLKPDNVMISAETGRAVVADFGIAVELNQLGHAAVDRAGTRGYMSPEQAAGASIDARTDVFALGVLGHRMLTGELPSIAPTRVRHTDLGGPVSELPGGASPRLVSVIKRCLEADPAARPADAAAVLDLLTGRIGAKRSRRVAAAIAAAALAVFAALIGFLAVPASEPLVFAAPRVVVESVDVSRLDEPLHWYESAFARRLVNELEDAWAISARTGTDPGAPPRPSDLRVSIALHHADDGGLAADLSWHRFDRADRAALDGGTLQELAEACARRLVEQVAEPLRHPQAAELRQLGIAKASAWRDWRRARRAAIRQEWSKVRVLADRALVADPTCIPCLVEKAWSYGSTDEARIEPLERVAKLAPAASLGGPWPKVVEFVAADRRGDQPRMDALVAEMLEKRVDHLYVSYRVAAGLWFAGLREQALPQLEWHVEKFPRISGVAKHLAEHYLDLDGDEASEQALRYAEHAVDVGADDLAARSQLGRALLRVGREKEARAQVAIIESAGPEEKQQALAGGERTNSLFDLYMALREYRRAAQAARRLYNGSPQQQGSAAESLAFLAYLRGDLVSGKRLHDEALEKFVAGSLDGFVHTVGRRRVWILFSLGECRAVIKLVDETPSERREPQFAVLAELCRYRLSGRRRASLEPTRAAIEALDQPAEQTFFRLILAVELGDWKQALSFEDIAASGRKWIGAYAYLGRAAMMSGDLDRAARFYETLAAHRFAWTEPIGASESRLEAARLRRALGQTDRAARHYRAYLDQLDEAPPSHAGVATAKRALETLR